VAGGLATAFGRAAELGCDAIQIFVKNANQWRARPLADDEAAAFRAARRKPAAGALGAVFAHASYLINLAATDATVRERSLEALADELERCGRLGVNGLVVHPGAHLGAGESAGIERVAAALEMTLAGKRGAPTRILLENTAGQGSCLGHRIEHLAEIRQRLSATVRRRVGFCIDTCHAFAAGYAIHQPAGWRKFVAELDEQLGLTTVACIHVNDSLRPFASRRDRHAHIGEGEIGLAAFGRLLAEPALAAVPMVVETDPGDDMAGHRSDLEALRRLRSRAASRRAGASTGRTRSRSPSASG
jgi:deoxyribonuclease-4